MKFFNLQRIYPVPICIASALKVYKMHLESIESELDRHLDEGVGALCKSMHHTDGASFFCDRDVFYFGDVVMETRIWVRQ